MMMVVDGLIRYDYEDIDVEDRFDFFYQLLELYINTRSKNEIPWDAKDTCPFRTIAKSDDGDEIIVIGEDKNSNVLIITYSGKRGITYNLYNKDNSIIKDTWSRFHEQNALDLY